MSEDLLRYVVDYALSIGAGYAEARYQLDESLTIVVRGGKVIAIGSSVSEGIGVRVLYGNVLSFSATNRLSRDELLATVRRAVDRARALSHLTRSPYGLSDNGVCSGTYRVNPVRGFDHLSIDEKLKLLGELHRAVVSTVKEARVPTTYCEYVEHVQRKLVMNSDGGFVDSLVPRLSLTFNLVMTSPQRGSLQRLVQWGASGGLELIELWRPVERVEDEARRLEGVLIRGVEPPRERVDVVLGPEVVGLAVHESAGHPMEADRILGREAAQAGESFVRPEHVGSLRIGNELATVVDDPTIPGSYGYYEYDDECVRARPRYLYVGGVVNEPMHNRYTAYIFSTRSNGAARSMDYASEPIIRMSNTYLRPGDMEFDELIEDIRLGVYIKSYMEWNIDDVRWNQRYVGLESYLIVGGELGVPVRNPALELTTAAFYGRMVGTDRNLEFYPGVCGKGEPSQGVPVWFGGPNVRLSSVRLGVTV